ncbi:uncharacterized protein V1513DRAFT_442166 [Lipomyces chichibuensis]|uniref:uncharacterized protein n=1 Tax=Lipomyces chichibuensis TaxID=1546026 RepID=UPI003342F325
MLSAREERKMMARIKQLEQEEEREHSHHHSHSHQDVQSGTVGAGVIKKRKRSSQQSGSPSPKHTDGGPNGHGRLLKARQQSPSINSDRSSPVADRRPSQSHRRDPIDRKTTNGVDHPDVAESEMSTDDDVDWLPPKLLLVRKFFRTREKELAKMSPDSMSSRGKAGTSEPVSPSDTDVSSRKGSTATVKEERHNSPDVAKARHKERDDRSMGSSSPVLSPVTIPASTSSNILAHSKRKSQSPLPRPPLTESVSIRVSANSEAAAGGPWVPTSPSGPPPKSKSGPNLAELFSDSVEEIRRETDLQARRQSPSITATEPRQTTSTEDSRPPLPSQSPPALTHPPPQQHIQSPLQSQPHPPTPPQRIGPAAPTTSDTTTTASSTNGVKPTGLRVQLPPQSPFQVAFTGIQQPGQGQIVPPLGTPGSVSATAANPMHSPFALTSPSPVMPSCVGPTPQPPRPVKKLSFADYRKKQNPGGKEKETEKGKTEEVKKD